MPSPHQNNNSEIISSNLKKNSTKSRYEKTCQSNAPNSTLNNHQTTEKKRKIRNWVKRLMQPTVYHRQKPSSEVNYNRSSTENDPSNYKSLNTGYSLDKHRKESSQQHTIKAVETGISAVDVSSDDYFSDTFSIQGMRSLKKNKLGKPQGIQINQLDVGSELEIPFVKQLIIQKHTLLDTKGSEEIMVKDKAMVFALESNEHNKALEANGKIKDLEDLVHADEKYTWHAIEGTTSDISVAKTDMTSVFSEELSSLLGQQTMNSSLLGIAPHSILDNIGFNNSYRLPTTTLSIASQSLKNYKAFSRAGNMNNCDYQTGSSIFSGVGTTSSHYNYYYNPSCESGSNECPGSENCDAFENNFRTTSADSSSNSSNSDANDSTSKSNMKYSSNGHIVSDLLQDD